MSTRNLIDLSSTAAVKALEGNSLIVLPTGAIEHHGPHLPLSTDILLADAGAQASVELAAANGVNAWVLPGLAYTKSDEHHWAPGTMWLSWDTLMRTVVDIASSIAATPCTRLVFYNGHGGNAALLQVACREIRRRFGLQTFLIGGTTPADGAANSANAEFGLGLHGGQSETSAVMHVRPDLVHLELADRHVPEHLLGYEYVGFGKSASFGWLSDDFDGSGVIGDPTIASAQLGRQLWEESIQHTAAVLAEIAIFDRTLGRDAAVALAQAEAAVL